MSELNQQSTVPIITGSVRLQSVIIKSSSGTTVDVLPQISSIEFCEDIFQMFLTGQAVIQDNQNLINLFPLIGNEIIYIKFYTPGQDQDVNMIESQFFITSCSGKSKVNATTSAYIITFVSFEAIVNSQTRISKTYRGNPHHIVEEVIVSKTHGFDSDKLIVTEPATNNIAFISNWWHPDKVISYCCNHAINDSGNPSFLFFETRIGFIFTTLSKLCSADKAPVETFILTDTGLPPQTSDNSTVTFDPQAEYRSIRDVKFEDNYDFFERSRSGFYGSETIAYDHYTNQYSHFYGGRVFGQDDHLNQFDPVPTNAVTTSNATVNFVPYATNTFDGYNQGIVDSNATYVGARRQLISKIGTTKATIRVPGKGKYTAGQVVNLIIHKDQVYRSGDKSSLDMVYSGRYLIASIKHVVTPYDHYCNIGLIKDSYMFDPNRSAIAE